MIEGCAADVMVWRNPSFTSDRIADKAISQGITTREEPDELRESAITWSNHPGAFTAMAFGEVIGHKAVIAVLKGPSALRRPTSVHDRAQDSRLPLLADIGECQAKHSLRVQRHGYLLAQVFITGGSY